MNKDSNGYLVPRKTYVITSEHRNSCILIAVFSTAEVRLAFPELMAKAEETTFGDGSVVEMLDAHDKLVASLSPRRSFNRGVGRAFATLPLITSFGKRNIVVKQFRALDT